MAPRSRTCSARWRRPACAGRTAAAISDSPRAWRTASVLCILLDGEYTRSMPRKSVAKARCALCGAKEVSEPRGEEKYCRDCWEKKIAVEEIVAREFALKRYIRAHSAEKYLIYHSTLKRPCGQLIVVDD